MNTLAAPGMTVVAKKAHWCFDCHEGGHYIVTNVLHSAGRHYYVIVGDNSGVHTLDTGLFYVTDLKHEQEPARASRAEVFAALDSERAYQDAKGVETSGVPHVHSVEEFALYMDDYMTELKHVLSRVWGAEGPKQALHIVRKVTALGVSCMETNGAPPREGFEGSAMPELISGQAVKRFEELPYATRLLLLRDLLNTFDRAGEVHHKLSEWHKSELGEITYHGRNGNTSVSARDELLSLVEARVARWLGIKGNRS